MDVTKDEDKLSMSKEKANNMIAMLLGGRIAEENQYRSRGGRTGDLCHHYLGLSFSRHSQSDQRQGGHEKCLEL